ncbi:hypothetical protein BN971_04215 [Mycobacterium bohemicum DSM 44277]|uniref:Uncharacterized protein n=1 Tax=Mycobacterium bohemicum DSM 44277 TaxID=1236609 RepID=A0A0U0WFE8_MYCBE|nr:hypothetical protein BN971_04215 [Mycobacterium bohemicum DSM 44277]
MAALQAWISEGPARLDVVAPLRARACDALNAVRRAGSRRARPDVPLMAKGAERC